MTRVDFYILPDETAEDRQAFACKLIQKTSKMGHRIYIHCDSEADAHAMDKLLWSFQETSFIPHRLLQSEDNDNDSLIDIGFGESPGNHHDLLINLTQSVPNFFSRFERVAEIVVQAPEVLTATRDSYRFYANKNYPLHRHDLRKNQG